MLFVFWSHLQMHPKQMLIYFTFIKTVELLITDFKLEHFVQTKYEQL